VQDPAIDFLLHGGLGTGELIQSARLFDNLAADQLKRLLPLFELVEYQAGESILVQGQPAEKIFFLLQGQVEVLNDQIPIFTLRRRGDIFGESSMLADQPCRVGVRALDLVRMLSIKGLELGSALNNDEKKLHLILNQLFTVALSDKLAASLDQAKELEMAERRLHKADQAKTNLLTLLNHELRTPLNGIIGMTQVLMMSEMTEEQKENCEIIVKSSLSLTSILNEILTASRLDRGDFVPRQIVFDLGGVVSKLVRLFSGAASTKGLELTGVVAEGLYPNRLGDPSLLEQVLVNLVANAVKYTERGKVHIEVSRSLNPQGVQMLRFEVADTGIGIAPEDQERILDPFTQCDQGLTRKYDGLGLGLALSSRFAALLGSKIRVDSSGTNGSRFWFEVELPQAGVLE